MKNREILKEEEPNALHVSHSTISSIRIGNDSKDIVYVSKKELRQEEFNHTEEIQDIISVPPSWLLRWGISLIVVIVLFILAASYFISYPEIVKVPFELYSTEPILPISAAKAGSIESLNVKNHDIVLAGQLLAKIRTDSGTISICANRSGIINYADILHVYQQVSSRQELFYVFRTNDHFFGVISIPQLNISSIVPGQQVLIKMRNYPYQDYGILRGKITYITGRPMKNGLYRAEVELAHNNLTDINKKIQLVSGMSGDADVITKKLTVFERITKHLFYLVK